ncbi:MAG: polynucleotide 5'-phosphatase [Amphiamblys sp. WSBS2006]|nr:MAG: polynucleotide 5'-phosphatase [Amphiamblys sp. WSBS2006]
MENDLLAAVAKIVYRSVKDFLAEIDGKRNVLEIEARLGKMAEKESGQRIYLPIASDAVISPEEKDAYRFDPSLPDTLHKEYNRLLNTIVAETARKGYVGDRVEYTHTRETDLFYKTQKGKVRKRVDTATQKTVQIAHKKNLCTVDIYLPDSELDLRLSVAIEMALGQDPLENSFLQRKKDRRSYTKENIRVDLSQTTQETGEGKREVHNELELEWYDERAVEYLAGVEAGGAGLFMERLAGFLAKAVKIAKRKNIFI